MTKFFTNIFSVLVAFCLMLGFSANQVHAEVNQQELQTLFSSASSALSQMDTLKSEIGALVDEVSAAGTPTAAKPKADQVVSKSLEAIGKAKTLSDSLNQIAAKLKSAGGAEAQKGTQLEQTVDAALLVFNGAEKKVTDAKSNLDNSQAALTKGDIETAANTAYEAVNASAGMANDILQSAATLAGVETQAATDGTTSGSATTGPAPQGETFELNNPLKTTSIPQILGNVISMFLGIVGALALAAFVYGGIMYMTARGSTEQVKKAVDTIKSAVIGLLIIAFSYTITNSFIKIWTTNPIPGTVERAPAISETTQADEEAQQLQTTVQGQAEADAAAQEQGKTYAEQAAEDTKHWAEQFGCDYFIKKQDPNTLLSFSCMDTAGLSNQYVCYKLNPDPCGTAQACCAKNY